MRDILKTWVLVVEIIEAIIPEIKSAIKILESEFWSFFWRWAETSALQDCLSKASHESLIPLYSPKNVQKCLLAIFVLISCSDFVIVRNKQCLVSTEVLVLDRFYFSLTKQSLSKSKFFVVAVLGFFNDSIEILLRRASDGVCQKVFRFYEKTIGEITTQLEAQKTDHLFPCSILLKITRKIILLRKNA